MDKPLVDMSDEEINDILKKQGHKHPINSMYVGEDGLTYMDVSPQFLAKMIAKGQKTQ